MSSIIKTNKTRKTFGFTLVELIVVITILVILGTIAFIQLGGFAGSARDSARVSDLTNITQGLELILVKNGVVIPPDASDKGVIAIMASGTPIGYQGYAGTNVLSSIKMSDARDPLDKKYYTYVTNATYSKYQILGLMEDSSTLVSMNDTFGINQVYAGYETRIPATKGSTLGVLLGNTGVTLNMPVQELYESSSFTGVDLFTQVFTGSSNFSIAGEALNSVSSSPESCDTWIKNYPSLLGKDGTYRIKPSKTSSTLSVYCDMTTDGGGWSLVANWSASGTYTTFPGNSDLDKSYSSGTYSTTWNHSTNYYMNFSNFLFTDIKFISGNNTYACGFNYNELLTVKNSSTFAPNIVIKYAKGTVKKVGEQTNILWRPANGEDPWIGCAGDHTANSYTYAMTFWGENGGQMLPPNNHATLANDNNGIGVFIR